jgi:hypothetical protein
MAPEKALIPEFESPRIVVAWIPPETHLGVCALVVCPLLGLCMSVEEAGSPICGTTISGMV